MVLETSPTLTRDEIRVAVREFCTRFPDEYWCEMDEARSYPEEFVMDLTQAGWLSILIPAEFGEEGWG